jgi:hypothetical protein
MHKYVDINRVKVMIVYVINYLYIYLLTWIVSELWNPYDSYIVNYMNVCHH